jgi:hypothetical protein
VGRILAVAVAAFTRIVEPGVCYEHKAWRSRETVCIQLPETQQAREQ